MMPEIISEKFRSDFPAFFQRLNECIDERVKIAWDSETLNTWMTDDENKEFVCFTCLQAMLPRLNLTSTSFAYDSDHAEHVDRYVRFLEILNQNPQLEDMEINLDAVAETRFWNVFPLRRFKSFKIQGPEDGLGAHDVETFFKLPFPARDRFLLSDEAVVWYQFASETKTRLEINFNYFCKAQNFFNTVRNLTCAAVNPFDAISEMDLRFYRENETQILRSYFDYVSGLNSLLSVAPNLTSLKIDSAVDLSNAEMDNQNILEMVKESFSSLKQLKKFHLDILIDCDARRIPNVYPFNLPLLQKNDSCTHIKFDFRLDMKWPYSRDYDETNERQVFNSAREFYAELVVSFWNQVCDVVETHSRLQRLDCTICFHCMNRLIQAREFMNQVQQRISPRLRNVLLKTLHLESIDLQYCNHWTRYCDDSWVNPDPIETRDLLVRNRLVGKVRRLAQEQARLQKRVSEAAKSVQEKAKFAAESVKAAKDLAVASIDLLSAKQEERRSQVASQLLLMKVHAATQTYPMACITALHESVRSFGRGCLPCHLG